MGTQVTLANTIRSSTTSGATHTQVEPLVSPTAVPLPTDIIADLLACRSTSDTVTAGVDPVVRTTVLSFVPTIAATAVLVLDSAGVVIGVTITNGGRDYILPPKMVATPPAGGTGLGAILKAFMNVRAITLGGGGAGYDGTSRVAFLGGLPPANLEITSGCVRQLCVLDPGEGYPAGTTVQIEGGGNPTVKAQASITRDSNGRITGITLTEMGAGYTTVPQVVLTPPAGSTITRIAKFGIGMAEGRPARATLTIVAGAITAINITDSGSGYVGVPTMSFFGAGSGATATARMQVERADIIAPGTGYTASATVVVTPVMQDLFPTSAQQDEPFFNLLKGLLSQGARSPVIPSAPVVA